LNEEFASGQKVHSMSNRSARRQPNEKQQLRTEIDAKRGEIRRLQDKYTADGERLKHISAHAEQMRTRIQDATTQTARLELQVEDAKRNESATLKNLESKRMLANSLHRGRIVHAHEHRRRSTQKLDDVAKKLADLNHYIDDRTQFYRETVRVKQAELDELDRALTELQDEEAQLLMELLDDNSPPGDGLAERPSGDDEIPIDVITQDDLDMHTLAVELCRLDALIFENAKLERQIETFTQMRDKLKAQVQALLEPPE
jgi:septal ring factor EnvC (AmiA/AmiB activator)